MTFVYLSHIIAGGLLVNNVKHTLVFGWYLAVKVR